jgi:hypothetical protein
MPPILQGKIAIRRFQSVLQSEDELHRVHNTEMVVVVGRIAIAVLLRGIQVHQAAPPARAPFRSDVHGGHTSRQATVP